MPSAIGRRELIAALGSAAVWPPRARAQQSAPLVGYLSAGSPQSFAAYLAIFRRGLAEAGFTEGQSVTIEYRWAEDQLDRLPELATDLTAHRLTVLFAVSNAAALAAKKRTSM